ncbi:putative bifunctional diguanylate cyclase/phosphodiesterase [Methylobacterium sp. ID0610]|uniref:putative bifunctional diguanylate cyclase/phosphodiesterase n=1 Tax=Methylobacterium carpenticola TaxID=3344827 RepID=UPI0036C4D6BD
MGRRKRAGAGTSLAFRLRATIVLIGASLLALTAVVVVPSVGALVQSRRKLVAIGQFTRILDAANRISAERGPANLVMSLAPGSDAAAVRLRDFRAASDASLAALRDPGDPGFLGPRARPVPAHLVAAVETRLREARRSVDRVAALPPSARGREEITGAIAAMIDVVEVLQDVLIWEVRVLGQTTPDLVGPSLIAHLVSDLREHGGRIGAYIIPALAMREPLSHRQLADVLETRGRIREMWRLLRGQAVVAAEGPLGDLLRRVEADFLGEGLGLIDAVVAQGRESGAHALTADELTARYVPRMKPLEELRVAYLGRMVAGFARERDAARARLAAVACGALALLAALSLLLRSLRLSVLHPLLSARETVIALAEGREPAPSPATTRIREIDRLFDALAVLHIRMHERATLMASLRRQAETDGLTGLCNRRGFARAIGSLSDPGDHAAMLMIDLDGFKTVNDTFGHDAGDDLIRQAGQRLEACLGTSGIAARMGGDEFAILLPHLREPAAADRTAEAILRSLADPFRIGDQDLHLGASIGVAVTQAGEAVSDDLLTRADMALYEAKRSGRHCHRPFRPEMRRTLLAATARQRELPRALAAGEFELHYQPQLQLRDCAVVGAEALLRWRHPELGLLAPADFLAPLRSSAHAPAVSRWVLRTACAQAAAWRGSGLGELRIAVNLFSREFHSAHLVDEVRAALAETGLPAAALELEITEDLILQHGDGLIPTLRALRAMGAGLAVDDYGTSTASLSLLNRCPVTRLKIDRSLVQAVTGSEQDRAVVRSILALGRSFDLAVLAEGIETEATLRTLAAEGCQEGQGYLLGRPLPAEIFAARCRAAERRDGWEPAVLMPQLA